MNYDSHSCKDLIEGNTEFYESAVWSNYAGYGTVLSVGFEISDTSQPSRLSSGPYNYSCGPQPSASSSGNHFQGAQPRMFSSFPQNSASSSSSSSVNAVNEKPLVVFLLDTSG